MQATLSPGSGSARATVQATNDTDAPHAHSSTQHCQPDEHPEGGREVARQAECQCVHVGEGFQIQCDDCLVWYWSCCVGLKLVSEEAASPHKFLCPKCCDELPATDANNEVKAAYPGAWVLPEARDDSFDAGEYLTNLRIVTIEESGPSESEMMDIEDDKDEEMMNEGEEDEDEDSEGEEAEKVEEGGALSSSFSSSSSCSFLDIAAESEESSDTDSQSDALSEMLVAMRSKSPAHLLEMLAVLTTPDAQLNMLTDAIQEFDSNWFHDDFVHVAQNLKAASAAGFPIDAVLKVLHAQLYSPLEANQFLRPTLFTRVEPIMRLCAENSNIDAKERMQGLQACLRSQNPGAIKLTRDALIKHHPNEPIESKLDKQCVKLVAAYAQISEARLASLTGSGGHDVSSSSSSCSSSSTARSWVSSSSSSSSSTADSIAVANRRLTEIALVNHEADICDEIQDKESEKAAHRHAKRKRAASDEDVVQCRTEKRQEMRDKDIDRELRLFRSDCERRRRKGVSVQSVTAIYEVYCQWRAARRSVLWAPATLEECRYNFQENILDETILQFPRNA